MHIHCPHCRSPVEVVEDQELRDVICPSCGSSFNLLRDETVTRVARERKILGHFELVERIGIGAFGEVWKAHDTELDRMVAVKLPRKGQLTAEEAESFLREARSAARLNHPGIVAVHEVGRADDQLFIVSDYVRGLTLADWLTGTRPTPKEAAATVVQLADAVQHAHEHGVIHRDLKPSNVMLDDAGQPRIMDFGLAKREAGEITMTVDGKVLGTPAYMSPEQARGAAHDADARSDVYSLGVILFELLTGELPFRGNARMLVHQVINEEAPSPRRFNGSLPRDVETICLKCLEKNPLKRYATARELKEDLRRYVEGKLIRARPVTALSRAWRWCQRTPIIAGLSAAVLGLLLTIAIAASATTWREVRLRNRETSLRKDANRLRYLAEMNLARQAWDDNDVARTRLLVDCWIPTADDDDFRGFEWFYLQGLLRRSQLSREVVIRRPSPTQDSRRHGSNSAFSLAMSMNRTLAVAYGTSVRTYDLASGDELSSHEFIPVPERALAGRPDMPLSWTWAFPFIAITRDGERLAYRDDNPGVLAVRESKSGQVIRLSGHPGYVRAADFDPQGRRLVSASGDGQVAIWDLEQPAKASMVQELGALVWCVAFSPDGNRVAIGLADNTTRIWNLKSGRVFSATAISSLTSSASGVLTVAFSPDGRFVVSGNADRTVRVWDVNAEQLVGVLVGHTDEVRCVAVSPDDGKIIASGSRDQSIRLWDLETLRLRAVLRGHDQIVQSLAFSPDGGEIVSCDQDGTILRWSNVKDEGGDVLWCDGAVTGLALSPDGNVIAAIQECSSEVWIWHCREGSKRPECTRVELQSIAEAVAISPAGYCAVVCQDGSLQLRQPPSGELRARIPREAEGHATDHMPFAFSPDGKWLAMGCSDGTVRVWYLGEHETAEITPLDSGSAVWSLAFGLGAPEQKLFVGCANGTVTVWTLSNTTGRTTKHEPQRLLEQGRPVMGLAVAANGETLATGSSGGISLWNAENGKHVATLVGGRSHYSIAFPDDRTMISSGGELPIRIWDLEQQRLRFTLTGHSGAAWHMRVSKNGRTVVSGGLDGAVRIWQAPTDLD